MSGLMEEMLSSNGDVWEVRWLFFEDVDSFEKVNEALANIAAGWEPYDSRPNPEGGWLLMVKRQVSS